MKNIIKAIIVFIGLSITSCTEEAIERENLSASLAPVLRTPTSGLNIVLVKDNANDLATSFVWDYAAYNGTSTVINYSIEFDEAGTSFKTPTVVAITTSKFKTFTVGELNTAALDAGFAPFNPVNIDVRVKATVGTTGTALPQVSNSFTITLTPYPSWPNWGIIGSATPTGWTSDTNMDYNLNTKLYSITIALTANHIKFRLDDSWAFNFGDDGNNLTLEQNGADIPIPVAGTYKIVANFDSQPQGGYAPRTYTRTLQ